MDVGSADLRLRAERQRHVLTLGLESLLLCLLVVVAHRAVCLVVFVRTDGRTVRVRIGDTGALLGQC
jgi:hypothetical protein